MKPWPRCAPSTGIPSIPTCGAAATSAEDAQDLTQGFFARLLEKHALQVVDPARGRFRSFLLASLDHYVSNERDRDHAQKRGSGMPLISLDIATAEDRYVREPSDPLTPEHIFNRNWALAVLDRVLARLREELQAAGKAQLFESLKGYLTGDAAVGSYQQIGSAIGMTEGALKVAVHRCGAVIGRSSTTRSRRRSRRRRKSSSSSGTSSRPSGSDAGRRRDLSAVQAAEHRGRGRRRPVPTLPARSRPRPRLRLRQRARTGCPWNGLSGRAAAVGHARRAEGAGGRLGRRDPGPPDPAGPILAALAHPNAARTLDLAASGDPAPFIATEYIRGSPITVYCERLQIPRAERLELLESVAALLRCAHKVGVIHGGISPSNVLISGPATAPSVKVTDFGLRLADERADALAMSALAGSLLGLLARAFSPQVSAEPSGPPAGQV